MQLKTHFLLKTSVKWVLCTKCNNFKYKCECLCLTLLFKAALGEVI